MDYGGDNGRNDVRNDGRKAWRSLSTFSPLCVIVILTSSHDKLLGNVGHGGVR